MITLLGIDPGYTGALAFLDPGSRALRIEDMPTAPNTKGRIELDLHRLGQLLGEHGEAQRLVSVLEFVAARPGQGAPATFRFGQGYGAIQMALVGHGWERHSVTPTKWKKHFGLSSDKGVSRALAAARFPDYADHFTLVKHDGRAEAALIALYALETIL